ncbi:hypothetical protein LAZ67_15003277 [Cordylochernes scorpioides]|uniref:C2H2-type domain-containing protein n=1 Tax=Cordylochernes scorpioides TaxID=51811 RepID=A0ABY6LBD6_9ARAC|nr:hypothetical protein LAZ67_15003277 [Cordylochernes scorpioides]
MSLYIYLEQMENNESLTVISAWKNFTMLDCVKHISLSYTVIKQTTLNSCWKIIVQMAHSLGREGFDDFTDGDIAELMADKELCEDDLVNLEKKFSNYCSYSVYRTNSNLHLQMYESVHTEEKPYSCPHCDFRTKWSHSLKLHQLIHTGDKPSPAFIEKKPFPCPYCDYRTTAANKLKLHQSIHTGEKPYSCPHCHYRTAAANKLKLHQSIHTGEKPYPALINNNCKQIKTTPIIHTGEKPYSCPHCDYRTTAANKLKLHQSIHTGEKPYSCPHCDYRTAAANKLKIHQLIHTGEKPYSCSHCDYKTSRTFDLKKHQYKHTGEKPYTCLYCSYSTVTASSLKIHQLTHTGEKPFPCPHCDYRTITAGKLKNTNINIQENKYIPALTNMPRHSRRLLGRNTAASRRYRNARAIETPLQSETRRALRRLRYSEARVAATQTMQVPVQRIQLWTHKPFSGLQYNAHIDYKADSSVDIGQMSRVCQT